MRRVSPISVIILALLFCVMAKPVDLIAGPGSTPSAPINIPVIGFFPDTLKFNFTSCNATGTLPLKIYNSGGSSLNYAMSQVSNFFEDFENGLERWQFNGYWGISADAYAGSGSLDDYPNSYYFNYANQTITLKDSLLVQDPDSCYLKFWLKRSMECCCDYLRPQISVNGGSWVTLSSYNCNYGWQQIVLNLSSYVASGDLLRFRFVFTADYSVIGQGVNIDNLYIGGIGASSNLLTFSPDAGNILPGDSSTVNITVNTEGLNSGVYYILAIINSNDPLNPSLFVPIMVTIDGIPEIQIDSTVMTMPAVMAYTSSLKTIWIRNSGCDTLLIDTIISSNAVFIPQNTSYQIKAYDSAAFTLLFSPVSAGTHLANLVFYNNDVNISVAVSGLATPPPVIAVSPESFNFSMTDCEEVYTANLTLYNNGLTPLSGELGSTLGGLITPPICQPDNTLDCAGRGIIQVELNNLTNESSNGCAGYQNFDTLTIELQGGSEYYLAVTTGSSSENVRVWIDYNADQYFDPVSELIFYSEYDNFHSTYFIVPNGLPVGVPMRMRVMSDYYYSPPFTACTNPVYGQAEDYTIYIQSDVPQITPGSFEIPAGDSAQISVVFQANQLWSGQFQGNIFAMSNDPLNPMVTIPYQFSLSGPAQFELSTLSMNYPDILQYTCHLDSFLVANNGCDSLFVTGIITPGPEFTVNQDTFMLLPGFSKYVSVLFCTEVTGFYDGTIQVLNNVANGEIYISCNVLGAPMIQVNPDSLSAVINSCGDSLTLPFTIYNPGTDTLTYEFIPVSNFFEDFENGLDKWNYTGYWGISADAYEGNGSLDEYPNYSYFNNMSQYITLKDSLIIQEPDSCIVKFWFRRYMECCCDYLEPQIQVNGGSWISLSGYNCNNDWEYINLSVATYVSAGDYLKFRFWFHSDYSAISSGINIDNLYIGGLGSSIITNAGTGASWLSISPDSANVLPGDSTQVNFTFYSQNVPSGSHFQIVNLISNSPLTPNITIPVMLEVNGQAVASAQPDHLYFPSTMEMMESSLAFSMINTGCDTLFVDSIFNPSVHFRVEPMPVYVLPYQSVNMQAIFSPQDTGTYQYQMVLSSNIGVINLWFEGDATGAPDAAIEPDTLVVTLNSCNETQNIPLTLSNSGLVNLDWNVMADFSFDDNTALYFDSPSDYVYLGYWTAGSQWTLEAWVKPSSLPAGRKTIMGGLSSCVDYAIVMQGGQFGVAIRPPGVCSQTLLSPDYAVVDEWYHISATNDGSVAKLYVNGVLKAEGPVDPNYVGFYYSYMGYEYCCYDAGFPGTIDEVRVWNYPRTSFDINNWMNRLLLGNESGLFAYYRLDEGAGTTVNDLSIHNYDGSMYYADWVNSDAPINDFLQISPITGSLAPGSSTQINLDISSEHLLSGTYQGNIIINSNDPVKGEIIIPITIIVNGQPEITSSDTCLSFGSILQYDSKYDTLYITNTGCDTLFISDIVPSSAAFTTNVSEYMLPPGMQVQVIVLFNPSAIGSYTDTLWVNSNDEAYWICLSGAATPRPNMVVSSTVIQDTMVCELSGTRSLVVKNTGVIPLEYTIPVVAQNWLTITPHTGLLLTGDSAVHQISYTKVGLSAGIHEGMIVINSNDPLNSPKNISVQLNVLNAYHPLNLGPDVNVCIGEAVTLNAGPGYESYLWNTGSTNNSITVVVPGAYSLMVKDFGYDCYFYDTVSVNWYNYPIVFAGNDTTICQGSDYTFSPQFQNLLPISPSVCQIGTGTSVTSNVGPSPFGTYYMDDRTQMLYKVTELVAAGLSSGGITAIALNVFGIGSPAMQGFTIRMGHTTNNALTGFVAGNTVVYTQSSYTPATGWNVFTFQTPFYWNGTQNIVVEICFNNNSYISSSGVQYTSVANSVWSSWCDNCTPGCNLESGSSFSERANIQFYGSGDPTYYTWNGPNGYISHSRNAVIHNVGFSNAGFYYLTTDNSYGCIDKDTVIVAVNPSPVVIASNDVSIVYGTSTQLDVSITGGISPFIYKWTPTAGLSSTVIANPMASPTTSTTYAVKVTSQNQCSDEDNVVVTVLPIYQINGTITYKNASATPLGGLTVYLKGTGGVNLDTSITDQGGSYLFDELINNTYTYSVVSNKTWGGANATDALLVAKHIVFLYSLSGLNLTAADVNNSGTLSSADPLLILRRSVGSLSSFPAGDWLFTTSPVVITNANVTHNVQGLCFGDVNGTLVPGNKAPPLVVLSESGTAAIPESLVLDVGLRCPEALHAGAVTLGFSLSGDIEEILDVEIASNGLEWNVTGDNILRIAWENSEGISLEPGDLLLTIRLRLKENADYRSPLFTLDGDCEIADPEGRVLTETPLTIPHMVKVAAFAAFNAEAVPNPFVDDVSLVYDIPEDGKTTIRLYDVYGRLLKEILDAAQVSGHYKMLMSGENLPAGVYQLEFRHLSPGNIRQKTVSIVKTH